MGLIENIYNNSKNPIDNPEVLTKLLELYSIPNSILYNGIISANNCVDSRRMVNSDADEFYTMIFSMWKKSITSLTREEFIELYKNGIYDNSLITLREYLLKSPDPKTSREVLEFINLTTGNKELDDAMHKYKWSRIGEESGWTHICSACTHAKRSAFDRVEHRLYLRVDSLCIYRISKCFIEKCEKTNLPYYFKFVLGDNRDDSIVVYSSTENLEKYIEILNEIRKEHPEINGYIGKPPLLTSPVNDWIGYGSEPTIKQKNGELYSFNLMREEIIEKAIKETTSNWLQQHRYMEIPFQGKNVRFDDYIMIIATERFTQDLERRYNNLERMKKEEAQRNNKPYNEQEVIDYLGYKISDIKHPVFKENICRVLTKYKDACLNTIINDSYKNFEKIDMYVRNNKKIYFSSNDLQNTIKAIIPRIAKNDSEYIKEFQIRIKETASKYGIDPNNFSFDTGRLRAMRIYDDYVLSKQLEEQRKQEAINSMLQKEVKKPRERLINETDEEYERYLREFYNGGNPKS